MIGRGLPVRELLGTFDPQGRRRAPNLPLARDAASLQQILRQHRDRRFNLKTAAGAYGWTNLAVDRFDRSRDEVVLRNGDRVATEALTKQLDADASMGVLIQETLEPHEATSLVCGPLLSGLWMRALMRRSGPQILRCTRKVTTGANYVR